MAHDQHDQHAQHDQDHQHEHDPTGQGDPVEAGQPGATRATEHYRDDKVEHPGDEHTWGAAVTSLIGPTDATVDAVDPHEAVTQEKRSVEALLQEAVTAVRETHGGTHSRDVVRDALQRELELRGRWPQPEPWLDAVATEIEADGAYNVSTATIDDTTDDDTDDDGQPSQPSRPALGD